MINYFILVIVLLSSSLWAFSSGIDLVSYPIMDNVVESISFASTPFLTIGKNKIVPVLNKYYDRIELSISTKYTFIKSMTANYIIRRCLFIGNFPIVIPIFLMLITLLKGRINYYSWFLFIVLLIYVKSISFYSLLLMFSLTLAYPLLDNMLSFIITKLKDKLKEIHQPVFKKLHQWQPKGPIKYVIFWYFNFILFIRSMFEYTIIFILFSNITCLLILTHIFFDLLSMGSIIIIIFYVSMYILVIDTYGEFLSDMM